MEPRIPPHNLEAEQAVLGALLSNGATANSLLDQVSTIITTDDFYRDAHRIIYNAIFTVAQEGKNADMVNVIEELRKEKKDTAAGGIKYLTELGNLNYGSFNLEEHARIIADKAKLRRLIDSGNRIVGMAYAGEEEPREILDKAEELVLGVSGQISGESTFSPMGTVVQETLLRLNKLQQREGVLTGVSTGFRDLDGVTNGLQKSDLILVAARPSMGKTAFTLNIAQNVAILGNLPVAFFSLEMSKEQLVGRILSSVSGVDSKKLRRADLNQEEWSRIIVAAEQMSRAPLYIDDTPGLTVADMRSKLRRLKVEHGLALIIVDYIQLMNGGGNNRNSDNRQQEISTISRNLKLIAREMNVPLIALSQLSRSVESRTDKRPVLSDLRESGSLEQDADIVAFLYREKYYDPDTELGDITEVIIKKHRNGALATINLMFQGELTRFRDVTNREEP